MFQVNLYIETNNKGPSKRKAAGMYVLEFIRENGTPYTRNGVIWMDGVTENKLVLTLLLEALKRISKSSSLCVYHTCEHLFNVLNYHHLPEWEKRGWTNSKGKTTEQMLLWKEIKEYLNMHVVTMSAKEHSYRNIYMRNVLEKEMEREHRENVEIRKDV